MPGPARPARRRVGRRAARGPRARVRLASRTVRAGDDHADDRGARSLRGSLGRSPARVLPRDVHHARSERDPLRRDRRVLRSATRRARGRDGLSRRCARPRHDPPRHRDRWWPRRSRTVPRRRDARRATAAARATGAARPGRGRAPVARDRARARPIRQVRRGRAARDLAAPAGARARLPAVARRPPARGRQAGAEAEQRRAIDREGAPSGRAGGPPEQLGDWHDAAGITLLEEGKGDAAVAEFRAARARAEAKQPDRVSDQISKLATVLDRAGQYSEARTFAARAVELLTKELGPGHPDVAFALATLGAIDYAAGRYAAALADNQRALEIDIALGETTYQTSEILEGIGNAYLSLGKPEEAESYHRRVLAMREAKGAEDPHVADALINLG